MRIIHKTVDILHAKALTKADQLGTFEAVFAVFGNEDSDGDIVEPGVFIASWARKMPKVVWSHDWLQVPIGVTLEVDELNRAKLDSLVTSGLPDGVTGGAWAKARLLIDVAAGEDHPKAREVYSALKAIGGDGRPGLDEFSWGGRVTSETIEQRENTYPLYHINEVDQTEWGPCLKGANVATRLVALKSLVAADIVSRDEARAALGLKAEGDEPDADVDDKPDDDKPDEPDPDAVISSDWSQTLAAVRAEVLTVAEARERLGLPALDADTPDEPDEPDPDDAAGSAEVAELLL